MIAGRNRAAGIALAAVLGAGTAAADIEPSPYSKPRDYGHAPVTGVAKTGEADIVETAIKAPQFKTLVAALKAADMVSALRGKGPFTVFAPTDAAFAKLPKGTLEMLLKPENRAKLRAILSAHVVPELIVSREWQGRSGRFDTLDHGLLTLVSGKKVTVGKYATVVTSDIKASNGVIHVIDTVLTPVRD